MGASVSSVYTGKLRSGASDGGEMQEGAIAGTASGVGALDAGFVSHHSSASGLPNWVLRS